MFEAMADKLTGAVIETSSPHATFLAHGSEKAPSCMPT